ncbi:MAG: type II toxin-antitoxin system RelE/ParE family toxin [Isosphaeraceae bacterium]|nr:type II toxin-antitoxin system RelE/ParE family toxin [Isosphaeraceae bacterium]
MTLPVVLTRDAETDFDSAADWYEQQAGLGTAFTLRVRDVLARIGGMPELHAVLSHGLRRARVDGFPYCVYYRVGSERVEVVAILHARRDPSIWMNRG